MASGSSNVCAAIQERYQFRAKGGFARAIEETILLKSEENCNMQNVEM